MKPISIGAATAAVLAAGLILDELWIPGDGLSAWDWRFRALVICACCAVALVAGALTWFAAARLKRRRP